MSRSSLAFHWQGVDWQLLADKALWYPGEKTLFIADPHFGKSASFRSAGIPVPEGSTHDDCQRLSHLIGRTSAIRLVILGDFFHNAASRSSSVHRVLTDWRKRHTDLQVELVRGNHDHAAGDPWPDLKMRVHPSFWMWKGFCCSHNDQKPSPHPVLSGHVHPSVKLSVQGRRVYRLPCFWFRGQVSCTLPSFGTFTGSYTVEPSREDCLIATDGHSIMNVTQWVA